MIVPPTFLPYGKQLIEDDDIAAVVAVLRSESLTGGPVVGAFEQAFAERVGARYAVACANGTAALHLATVALGVGVGDRVIVPAVTFLATANGPHYTGAEVVFADVDPDTGLMTEGTLAEALQRADGPVSAVFPVHLNGACVDMPKLFALARHHGLAVVEDACHAVGATYAGGVPTGECRHSDMTIFSLHPVKTITMGEGGVITTNDEALYEKLLRMRNHGMVREPEKFIQSDEGFDADGRTNPWYYEMVEPGFNYRASELQCGLGLSQLGKLGRFLASRRALAEAYDRELAPLEPLVRPVPRMPDCDSGWHLYVVRIDFERVGITRAALMARLRETGIGTQVHYLPLHRQPYWKKLNPGLHLRGADTYYAACLTLPLFPAMTDDDVLRVVSSLKNIITTLTV